MNETNEFNHDELKAEKRQTELKLIQARARLEDVRCSLKVKSEIYKESSEY